MKKHNAIGLSILLMLAIIVLLGGCASTARMIDNASLQTSVVMQDSIFMNTDDKEKTAFVRVGNASEVQNVSLEAEIRDRLSKKGFALVGMTSEARWIIEVNLKSLTYAKLDTVGRDLSTYGTVAGGVAGALIPGGGRDSFLGAAIGGIIGNVAGAVAGSLVKIEAYDGTVDVQIQERVAGSVRERITSAARQGSSTAVSTERLTESEFQTYRTSLAVRAKRTNINLDEAAAEIAKKVADQIAGLF